MRRIRSHLTYANVMATVAVFIALGGGTTAVALSGTDTVQSDDLGPGAQVKQADVADNAVNSADIVNGSITGADIASSALPKGRATTSACNPSTDAFVDCGSVTVNLARSSRVLIIADTQWLTANAESTGEGICRIGVDGSPFGPDAYPGENARNTSGVHRNSVALTNVTGLLPAGNHTFGLACNEGIGNIAYDPTNVSVVVLGPG